MIQLGRFQRADGSYVGVMRTLTIEHEVRVVPIAKANDKSPDHRMFLGDLECGAAWMLADDRGGGVQNVKLDDPALAEPIHARLVRGQDNDFLLVWNRRTSD